MMKKVLSNGLIASAASIPLSALIFFPNALFSSQYKEWIPYKFTVALAFATLVIIGLWTYRRSREWINQKGKFLRLQIALVVTLLFTFSVFWVVWNIASRLYYVRVTGDESLSYLPYEWFRDYYGKFVKCWIPMAVISTILIYGSEIIYKKVRNARQPNVF